MRIGIFDPYLDDLGGGEKYMMTIAQCLSDNHIVDIFWDDKKDLVKLSRRFPLNLSKTKLVPNIFNPQTSILKRLVETKKYDAIVLLSDGSIPFVLSGKLFIHFQQPLPALKPSFKSSLKKVRVNAFFCNSKFTKSFIDKELRVNSKVIYPPVKIKTQKNVKENIILHVGRFRVKDVTTNINGVKEGIGDYKKQSVMLEAFKEMVNKGLKDWKLVIATSVNDGEMKIFETFKKAAEGFPIEFLVNKSNEELWDIYSKAKIYWHASGFGEDLEKNPEYAEHFGISTVEAMGAGAVPVVINAGGQKEIVIEGENGFLWDSINELQAKTLKLIQDEPLLNKLSKQAMESSKEFSAERFYQAVNNLILG